LKIGCAGSLIAPLASHRAARVSLALDARSLAYWDAGTRTWRVAPGCDTVLVGASSRELALTGVLAVNGARCAAHAVKVVVPSTLGA
jgi:hypothetical protein